MDVADLVRMLRNIQENINFLEKASAERNRYNNLTKYGQFNNLKDDESFYNDVSSLSQNYKTLSDTTDTSNILKNLAILGILSAAGLGGGYYLGRNLVSEPEKPGHNEALVSSLLQFLPLPGLSFGYGLGRRAALTKAKKKNPEKQQ